ncbi:restriction endonuclease [Saccharothrix syringae]|uniref:Restriction endonuclease n=1 Tax=Saccharothrix syringae TaxID=103733 RepID=A0A5Q0H4S7_SACSY|nr:restriction endonuclease [Saccharothrix syringae]QFZ20944.1 restriction endonuclease [Saccharothrix syringae]
MAARTRNRGKGGGKKRARGRSRRKTKVSPLLLVGGGIALFLLVDFVRTHPVLSALIAAALLAGGVASLVLWLRARRREASLQAERDRVIEVTDGMSGVEFERWTARLLSRSGCTDVRVVGGSGDAGADVLATAPGGGLVVVQCKRYGRTKVGTKAVQLFAGTDRLYHGADISLIVTTSDFTSEARKVAAGVGIVLVDRAVLAEWARTGAAPFPLSRSGPYRSW